MYRLLVFSPEHQATDLLDRYREAVEHLRDVLSIKNAQQEAQTEEEARRYLANLKECLSLITQEIGAGRCIQSPVDLFLMFRVIDPETWQRHPNQYRRTLVQFGPFMAPEPARIESLVENLFANLEELHHPALKAIYLHHELVRIHPFLDGNGRVSRMAKNWLLMYELYPPIFIYAGEDRKSYIDVLQQSFLDLEETPHTFGAATQRFFQDELQRVRASTSFMLHRMLKIPDDRFALGPEDELYTSVPPRRTSDDQDSD